MMSDRDNSTHRRLVRKSYDRIGQRYAEWAKDVQDLGGRERYADLFIEALEPGSRVLDLGCGDGSLLTARLAKRFRVVGVDLSIEQLRAGRMSLPDVQFISADAVDLEFPPDSFDGITSFYMLTHLPTDDLSRVVHNIARWLRPGGLFVGSFGATSDPGSVEPDWLGEPMYFSGLGRQANLDVVLRVGLEIMRESLETADEFGQSVTFHWIAARKANGGN
jgi:ubiquinone/menaquinone biosynthesis C-methylase UbiE